MSIVMACCSTRGMCSTSSSYDLIYTDETFYADNAITTLYGAWTLDFFCQTVSSFCISSRLNALHIHYIQNISTIFPFVLVYSSNVSEHQTTFPKFLACGLYMESIDN